MGSRKQAVLLPTDGKSKLIIIDKRYGNQKKRKYMTETNNVTVKISHTSFDIEDNLNKDFVKKVIDDMSFVNKKSHVLRILIAAYTYGIIELKDLEEKLDKLDKEIFI